MKNEAETRISDLTTKIEELTANIENVVKKDEEQTANNASLNTKIEEFTATVKNFEYKIERLETEAAANRWRLAFLRADASSATVEAKTMVPKKTIDEKPKLHRSYGDAEQSTEAPSKLRRR